jgi:hypothetical protein
MRAAKVAPLRVVALRSDATWRDASRRVFMSKVVTRHLGAPIKRGMQITNYKRAEV